MNVRRLLRAAAFATAAMTIIAAVSILTSCDGGEEYGTLRWQTSIDLPINISRSLTMDEYRRLLLPDSILDNIFLTERELDSILASGEWDNILGNSAYWDLGAESFPITSDFMKILKKTTDPSINYSLDLFNDTDMGLTFYGLLFGGSDSAAASLDSAAFYELVTSDSSDGKSVNLFGPKGMHVNPAEKGHKPMTQDTTLCNLLMREKAIACRCLVMINKPEGNGMADTRDSVKVNSVSINLRIKFSGVNSFDSLFTL